MGMYPVCRSHGVELVCLVAVWYWLTEAACAGCKPEQEGPVKVECGAGGISCVEQLAWDGCRVPRMETVEISGSWPARVGSGS